MCRATFLLGLVCGVWLADRRRGDAPATSVLTPRQREIMRGVASGWTNKEIAAAVGLREIAGYLAGGMTSWREDGLPVDRIDRMTVPELYERRDAVQVLDVRERSEWEAGHVAGSVHTPYHDIRALPDGIDPARPVAVICASGRRAAVAASLLKRLGAREVVHVVDGGVPQWAALAWPVDRPRR